MVKLNNL